MRILLRTSRWAIWARRLGSFALPLTVIPILMHRSRAITTDNFETIELIALGVALLALATSVGAISRIWITGDLGWGKAIAGLLLSLICLVPAGLWTTEFALYPMLGDASTDVANPPALLVPMTFTAPSAATQQQLASIFPNIKNRSYPVPVGRMFTLVDQLVTERGWDVRRRREPVTAGDEGQINAIAMTLLGFRDEVSIRVTPTADTSTVAMRSASLTALHQPGSNGRRIEEFLSALDARVTLLMKDQPAGSAGEEEVDGNAANQPVVPAPAPRGKRR